MIELKIHNILALLVMLFLVSALCSVRYKTSARANQYAVNFQSGVIHVPANYSTIQEAINHATPGDQILVQAGTYLENVVVNKSISLIGEDRESTIINGTQTGAVINITASNVNVTGFTIGKTGPGIPSDSGVFVMYSSFVGISNNKIIRNYEGVTVLFCNNVVISDNNVSANGYDGISLYSSVNVMVTDNIILSNSYNGISLYSSGYNSISGNTVSNSYNGIYLMLSSNNIVYHNNFDNKYHVYLSGSANIWSIGNEGNYWSRYAGQDLNGDGIGDLPFSIDENNQDDYPLMGRFSDFNVALKEEYHVRVISNSTVSDFGFGIGPETGNKIILFNATGGESTVGFCRIKIPSALMNYPFIVLVDNEEIIPTLLGISTAENSFLYFTYMHSSHTISIISSRVFLLYIQLFDNYSALQKDLNSLNQSYSELLSRYNILSENNTLLQEIYRELNVSYQEHLVKYSENMQNVQNLVYIFAATTAIFLITTVYLSKRTHANTTTKAKLIEEE